MKKTYLHSHFLPAAIIFLVTVAGLFSFNTARAQAPWCVINGSATPSPTVGGTITDFTIKDYATNAVVFNQTTAIGSVRYVDYTGVTINLVEGKAYTFEYTVHTASNPWGSRMGVDWDDSKNFPSAGAEVIHSSVKTSTALRTFVYTPNFVGDFRLRIHSRYNYDDPSLCGTTSLRTQYQDYSLHIVSGCTAPIT